MTYVLVAEFLNKREAYLSLELGEYETLEEAETVKAQYYKNKSESHLKASKKHREGSFEYWEMHGTWAENINIRMI